MPTYEYECGGCGRTAEFFHGITARAIKKCPHCGKFKLRRLMGTGAGIIFKGSGFYTTDYKRAGEKKHEEKKESSEGKKTDKATEIKSEQKLTSKEKKGKNG